MRSHEAGCITAFVVLLIATGQAKAVGGDSLDNGALHHFARNLQTVRHPPKLPPSDLPELQMLPQKCVLQKERDLCVAPNGGSNNWYSTHVAGDVASCNYTFEQATQGLKIIGGEVIYYFNATNEQFDIGARSGPEFTYIYRLQRRCKYRVCLTFRETFYDKGGQRVFDVYANNQPVLTKFDIFSITSHRLKPKVWCFEPELLTPWLVVHFRSSRFPEGFATVSEINVCEKDCSAAYRATLPPIQPPIPHDPATCRIKPIPPPCQHTWCNRAYPIALINAGGSATCGYTDDVAVPPPCQLEDDGTASDYCFPSDVAVSVQDGRTRFVDEFQLDVTRTWRWGKTFSYTWTGVPRFSRFYMRLIFSEQLWVDPFTRIFNVRVNNKLVIAALDVAALTNGGDIPYIHEYYFNTTDLAFGQQGMIVLNFDGTIGDAMISAIEIHHLQLSIPGTEPPLPPSPNPPPPVPPPSPPSPPFDDGYDYRRRSLAQLTVLADGDPQCTASPYGSPDDFTFPPWESQMCPDLVPESEIRRGLGAFRPGPCRNVPINPNPGVWRIAGETAWPCCKQCYWAPQEGDGKPSLSWAVVGRDLNLNLCPPCVRDRYLAKYGPNLLSNDPARSFLYYDKAANDQRCNTGLDQTPQGSTDINWLYYDKTGKCYARFSTAEATRLTADSRTSGTFDVAADFCSNMLSGNARLLKVENQDEGRWLAGNMLFQNGNGGGALAGAAKRAGQTKFTFPDNTEPQWAPGAGAAGEFRVDVPQRDDGTLCLQWLDYTIPARNSRGAQDTIPQRRAKGWRSRPCNEQTFICEKPAKSM